MPHKFKLTKYLHNAIRNENVELVKLYLNKGASLTKEIKYKHNKQVAVNVLEDCFNEPKSGKSILEIAKIIIDATSQKDFQNENDKVKIGLLFLKLLQKGAFDLADECIKPNVDLDWYVDDHISEHDYSDEKSDDDQYNSDSDQSDLIITAKKYTWDFLIIAKQYKILEHLITTKLTCPMFEDNSFLDKIMHSANVLNNVIAVRLIIDLTNKFSKETDVLEESKQTPDESPVTVSDKPCSFFDHAEISMQKSTAITPAMSSQ